VRGLAADKVVQSRGKRRPSAGDYRRLAGAVQLCAVHSSTYLARGESGFPLEEMVYEQFCKDATATDARPSCDGGGLRVHCRMLKTIPVLDVTAAIDEGEQLGIVRRCGQVAGEGRYVLHPLVAEGLLRSGQRTKRGNRRSALALCGLVEAPPCNNPFRGVSSMSRIDKVLYSGCRQPRGGRDDIDVAISIV